MAMPSKGPREQFTVRPTKDISTRLRQEAAELGLPCGDVISRALADRYDLPPANPAVIHEAQQELPMTG